MHRRAQRRPVSDQRTYYTAAIADAITNAGVLGYYVEQLGFSDRRARITSMQINNQSNCFVWLFFMSNRPDQSTPDHSIAPNTLADNLPIYAPQYVALRIVYDGNPPAGPINVYFSSREVFFPA